ncbi:MAG: hypothetical protein H6742_14720 [Alphaproteobacteria bacterium]|nr:hypothetical protein [Alphaproteobacteria bacterium]
MEQHVGHVERRRPLARVVGQHQAQEALDLLHPGLVGQLAPVDVQQAADDVVVVGVALAGDLPHRAARHDRVHHDAEPVDVGGDARQFRLGRPADPALFAIAGHAHGPAGVDVDAARPQVAVEGAVLFGDRDGVGHAGHELERGPRRQWPGVQQVGQAHPGRGALVRQDLALLTGLSAVVPAHDADSAFLGLPS